MLFNSNKIVSISEVNQNFSKIVRLLEKHKSLIVLKNNKPVFVLIDYKELEEDSLFKQYVEKIS